MNTEEDREYLLAIKNTLATIAAQVGELYAKVPRFELAMQRFEWAQTDHQHRLDHHSRRLDSLEAWRRDRDTEPILPNPPSLPPMRGPLDSEHEFDPALASLRADLVSKIKAPHHPLSESSALKLVDEEVERLRLKTDANRWRAFLGLGPMLGREALKALLTLAVGGGVVELLHLFRVLSH